MAEIELRFGVPEAAVAAIGNTLHRLGSSSHDIESFYWDSADGRLAAAHLSLRLRKFGEAWEQTLKAPGRNLAERLEETVPRNGPWRVGAVPDPALHAGTAAGALLERALRGHKRESPGLRLVHQSVVNRRELELESAGGLVELAFDQGTLRAGQSSQPICEVELELKRGSAATLVDFGRANVDAYGMWLSMLSKSARGEQLARRDRGEEASWAIKARRTELRREMTGPTIFRVLMASALDQVIANASALAAGEVDEGVVHQLRIGLRRLRTVWGELGLWRGSLSKRWEGPAVGVFRRLGDYRDRQTVATAVQQALAEAGSPDPSLRLESAGAPLDPVALVRDAAFQHALLDLLAFTFGPEEELQGDRRSGHHDQAVEATISAGLDRLHERLKRDARRFGSLDETQRHRVRKRLKRLRYFSEMVRPLFRGAGHFLRRLEPAQDALGHYMDLCVAADLARTIADRGNPLGWFNVGWLQAQMPEAIDACSLALRRATDVRPFWRKGACR